MCLYQFYEIDFKFMFFASCEPDNHERSKILSNCLRSMNLAVVGFYNLRFVDLLPD